MPQLSLHVPRYDLECRVELLPELAPASVAALMQALPAEGLVTTDPFYGANLCLRVPNFPPHLPLENPTIFPAPGDVFLFQSAEGAQLVLYYERLGGSVPAGTPFNALGAKPGSRVGVLTNLTPALAASAALVWRTGAAWGQAADGQAPATRRVTDEADAARQEIERRRAAWQRATQRDHVGQAPHPGRQVSLTIEEFGARSIVQLAADLAPETCAAIWDHLPISLTIMHGRYSGPEIFTNAAEVGKFWSWSAKQENPIARPIAGDMVLYVEPPPRLQLNYFHDRGSIPYGVTRPEIGNLVGSSVGDFSAFSEACWRLAYQGWKTLNVERVQL